MQMFVFPLYCQFSDWGFIVADDIQFICQCNAYMSSHFYKSATPTEIIGMLGSYECLYKVGVALGGAKGVACWEHQCAPTCKKP